MRKQERGLTELSPLLGPSSGTAHTADRLRKKPTFWKNGQETARVGNSVLMKSICHEGAKGDELGWKHAACQSVSEV